MTVHITNVKMILIKIHLVSLQMKSMIHHLHDKILRQEG